MDVNRRTLLQAGLWGSALLGANALGVPRSSRAANSTPFKRIAVEEEFSTLEVLLAQRKLLAENPQNEPGFTQFWGTMMDSLGVWGMVKEVVGLPGSRGLLRAFDLGEGRIEAMDEAGIDVQALQLTSPGVQVYDAKQAFDLAQSTNERLSEAVRARPDRLAGLATIAPQDPAGAAKELERAVKTLGLKGGLINS
ncbi:MAG: amidohydrolase family protein, partial [Proteobacteria bacterium]|nr:amidohydrolase family protein [Pseudomonadota bacterium]